MQRWLTRALFLRTLLMQTSALGTPPTFETKISQQAGDSKQLPRWHAELA